MLDDHEARITALEASQADYRAVLTAANALGANQREHSLRLTGVETRLTRLEFRVEDGFQETNARFCSVDEQLAEIKDLIIDRRKG